MQLEDLEIKLKNLKTVIIIMGNEESNLRPLTVKSELVRVLDVFRKVV